MKIIFFTFFLFVSFGVYSQTHYTYDASGHRTGRTLTLPQPSQSSDGSEDDSPVLEELIEYTDKAGDFSFSIFPNPTKGEVHIKSATETEGLISLYDMQGKVIYQYKGKLGNNRVDLRQQKRGLYVLRISSDGEEVNWKIIKE